MTPAMPDSPGPARAATVHDPRVLRAIAHPVRNRILTELDARPARCGPPTSRASSASRPTRRQLPPAPAGQVRPGRGGPRGGAGQAGPGLAGGRRARRTAQPARARGVAGREGRGLGVPCGPPSPRATGRSSAPTPPTAPRAALRTVTDESLRLTREEAAELAGEIDALIQGWGRRTRGEPREGRRTYQLFLALQPHPDAAASPGAAGVARGGSGGSPRLGACPPDSAPPTPPPSPRPAPASPPGRAPPPTCGC